METGKGASETVAELVSWTGTQPDTPTLDRAAAVALMPADDIQDPFTRLAAASLLGYRRTVPAAT